MAALRHVHACKLLCCQSTGLLLRQREQQLEPESVRTIEVVPAAEGAAPLKDHMTWQLQTYSCGIKPAWKGMVLVNVWLQPNGAGWHHASQHQCSPLIGSVDTSLGVSLMLWKPSPTFVLIRR